MRKTPSRREVSQYNAIGLRSRFTRSDYDAGDSAQPSPPDTHLQSHFVVMLGNAFVRYGAPPHRIEGMMKTCAKALRVEAPSIEKKAPGLDLDKLTDTYEVYKDASSLTVDVVKAMDRLQSIEKSQAQNKLWLLLLAYSVACGTIAMFGFSGTLLDALAATLLGLPLGFYQLWLVERFPDLPLAAEVGCAFLLTVTSRCLAFWPEWICLSAVLQGLLSMMVPGFGLFSACLELETGDVVAATTHIVSGLFSIVRLATGICLGLVLFADVEPRVLSPKCPATLPWPYHFAAAALCALCFCIISQAKWRHTPTMVIIAMVGYLTSFFLDSFFPGLTIVTNPLVGLAIGLMANLYSRLGPAISTIFLPSVAQKSDTAMKTRRRRAYCCPAAAAMPAIFLQVPGDLTYTGIFPAVLYVIQTFVESQLTPQGVGEKSAAILAHKAASAIHGVGLVLLSASYGLVLGLSLANWMAYPAGKHGAHTSF